MFVTYQPSGRVSFSLLPLLVVALLPLALLAYLYQLSIAWIPFIYINFLLTIGLGIGVGVIGAIVVRRGMARNAMVGAAVGLLLASAGIATKFGCQYYQVRASIPALVENEPSIPQELRQEVTKQELARYTFSEHLRDRVDTGWNIRGGQLGGIFVYVIWLLEAGIVFYWTTIATLEQARSPFNEKMMSWADEAEIVMTLPITDPSMVEQIKNAQNVDDLLTFPIPKTDQSNQFAIYTTNSIQGEELEDSYLSVMLQTNTIDRKGDLETDEKLIVTHAVLPTHSRKQLLENASLLHEALEAYRESVEEEESANPLTNHDADEEHVAE